MESNEIKTLNSTKLRARVQHCRIALQFVGWRANDILEEIAEINREIRARNRKKSRGRKKHL